MDAYRKGLCDKMNTLDLVGRLRRQLPDQEAVELCGLLTNLFRVSEMTSKQVGGCVVNVAALALSCLADCGPVQQLPELVFSRFPMGVPAKIEIWATELLPELQWNLMRHSERFGADVLNHIKTFAAQARASAYIYPPSAVAMLDSLERTAEWIEFQRFARSLSGGATSTQAVGPSLEEPPLTSALSSTVASALEDAGRRLRAEGEFDPKTAGDLIRSAMDQAHREIVVELESVHRKPYGGEDRDGGRRAYMLSVGFITQAEEKFFSAIYSFISAEVSHKLMAPRETVLFLHQTISNYLLLLTERLHKVK